MEFEEGVKLLVGWGLTLNQAKVILALAELGQATAKRIAQGSTVARETVYCVLMELQELGLIEKTLSRPVLFESIPLEEILSIMCEKKEKDLSKLKMYSRTFLKNFKENNVNFKLGGIPSKTMFLPPKILSKETQKAIKEAQESICFLLSCKKTSQALLGVSKLLTRKIDKKIKVQIVTENCEDSKLIPKILCEHQKDREKPLQIRHVLDRLPVHILLIDGKQVFVDLSTETNFVENSALWSNNPCIVALAQNYFDLLWFTSMQDQNHLITKQKT